MMLSMLTVNLRYLPIPEAEAFSGLGNGDVGSPFRITTCDQLQSMADNLAGYYALENDIDCSATSTWNSGAGFAAVGNWSTEFTGTFDGQNHTITGFSINRPGSDYVALFGATSGATIKNVAMTGVSIIGRNYAAAIAGTIKNSTVIQNIQVSGDVTGGLVVGGVIGSAEAGTNSLTKVSMTGNVTDTTAWGGGVIAYAHNTNIDQAAFDGTMTGTNTSGGITGNFTADGSHSVTLSNSYAVGTINDANFQGGITGNLGGYDSATATVINSFAVMTGTNPVPGIYGRQEGVVVITITNSYFDQTAAGTSDCGPSGAVTGCGAVNTDGTDGSHFQSLSVEPIQSWDLTGNWDIGDGGYPFLVQDTTTPYDPVTVPDAPTDLRIDPGNNQFSAYWTAPADNGGSPLTDYRFDFKPHEDGTWNEIGHATGTGTSMVGFVDLRVSNGNFYDFRVAAINAAGQGPYIEVDNFIVGNEPSAVNNLQYTKNTDTGSITATWEAPSDPGYLPVTGYKFYIRENGAGTWNAPVDLSSLDLTYEATGLVVGYHYDIKVTAISDIGESTESEIDNIILNDAVYNIATCDDLQHMQDDTAGSFTLAHDVDCSASSTWNDGAGFLPITDFTGTLDGGGFSIISLNINQPSADGIGLFQNTSNATISNLQLSGGTIVGRSHVGSLIGTALGELQLSNIISTALVSGGEEAIGGIIGYASLTDASTGTHVSNAYFAGTIQKTGETNGALFGVGGIFGELLQNDDAVTVDISNSTFGGEILTKNAFSNNTGGLIGRLNFGSDAALTLYNNHIEGIIAGGRALGGLIGYSDSSGGSATISYSYIDATLDANEYNVGGVIGEAYTYSSGVLPLSISQVYARGVYTGTGSVAGVVGYQDGDAGEISEAESRARISTLDNSAAGGIAGYARDLDITNSFNAGLVQGSQQIGGIAGSLAAGSISNSYNTGPVYGSGSYIGGIVGDAVFTAVSLTDNFNAGRVRNESGEYIGAIFGHANYVSNETPVVENNYYDQLKTQLTHCGVTEIYNLDTEDYDLAFNDGFCGAVNTTDSLDATYFLENHVNEPMVSWNFGDTWQESTGFYPQLQWNPLEKFTTINSCQDLQDITIDPAGNYQLGGSIDCSDSESLNGDTGFIPINEFSGTLDGSDYAISDLVIENSAEDSSGWGIFGSSRDATINNLTISAGNNEGNDVSGSLIGIAYDSLQLDHITADMDHGLCSGGKCGGLVGSFQPSSTMSSTLQHLAYGGIIPQGLYQGNIGGIIGEVIYQDAADVHLTDLNFTGALIVNDIDASNMGGFIGHLVSAPGAHFTMDDGTIAGSMQVGTNGGGAIGFIEQGNNSVISISDITVDAAIISGYDQVGGLVGQFSSNGDVDTSAEILRIKNLAPVEGGDSVGGIVGMMTNPSDASLILSASYNLGAITGTDDSGGLVGALLGASSLEDSYNAGSVEGAIHVGGVVGSAYYASDITDTYNTGSVVATDHVAGGLVGLNGASASVVNSFNVGSVASTGDAPAALIGLMESPEDPSNNFYDETRVGLTLCESTSEGPATTGCTAVNTPEAPAAHYFINNHINPPIDGWDIDGEGSIWITQVNSYPQLAWSPEEPLEPDTDISSCEDLQNIQTNPTLDYQLVGDIDCSGTETWNDGAGFVPIADFSGTLYGNTYAISNIFISPEGSDAPVGIFRNTSNAQFLNVHISNAEINAQFTPSAGILVGAAEQSIYVNGVSVDGDIICSNDCGGIIGYIHSETESDIVNSQLTVNIIGSPAEESAVVVNNGGAVGAAELADNASLYISNIQSTASMFTIHPDSYNDGGIIGYLDASGENNIVEVSENIFEGVAYGGNNSGGIIGLLAVGGSASVQVDDNIVATADVGAFTEAGGIIGQAFISSAVPDALNVSNNSSEAILAGLESGAGLISSLHSIDSSVAVVQSNQFTGSTLEGLFSVAGLVNVAENARLLNNYFNAEIIGGNVAGLVNNADNVSISNSYAAGAIYGTGDYLGGLVGVSNDSTIDHSFSSVHVVEGESSLSIGAVVGRIESETEQTMNANFNDTEQTGLVDCARLADGESDIQDNDGCQNIDTTEEPTYFFDASNDPMSAWDFSTVWREHPNDYPTLRFLPDTHFIDVSSCEDLLAINDDLSANYRLVNDIDCSGVSLSPIGAEIGFFGQLDGNYKTISHINIVEEAANIGLFESLDEYAAVYNLNITDSTVQGEVAVGMIASRAGDDVVVSGVSVTNSDVTCIDICGSVVGLFYGNVLISESYSDASVYTYGADGGGIAGIGYGGNAVIQDAYFQGTVTGGTAIGGILGKASEGEGDPTAPRVSRVYATGAVLGEGNVGGIIGEMQSGVLTDSFSATFVDAAEYMGSVLGITSDPLLLDNIVVDADAGYIDSCSASLFGDWCTLVNTDEHPDSLYFFDNHSNAPMDEWNFDGTWVSHEEDYPTLAAFVVPDDEPETFTVSTLAGSHGTVDPSGEVVVSAGEDQDITITPNSGYEIDRILVDGEDVSLFSRETLVYPFNDIDADHTLSATFRAVDLSGGEDDDDGDSDEETGSGTGTSHSGGSVALSDDALSDDAETNETKIVLNDFLDYAGEGKTLELSVGQVVYFIVDGEEHSATIKEIGDDFVILILASTPQEITLYVGETGQYDVTEDAVDDIQLTLKSVANDKATITFKQLRAPSQSTATAPETKTQAASTNWYWLITVFIVIIALIAAIIIWRRSKGERKGKK